MELGRVHLIKLDLFDVDSAANTTLIPRSRIIILAWNRASLFPDVFWDY